MLFTYRIGLNLFFETLNWISSPRYAFYLTFFLLDAMSSLSDFLHFKILENSIAKKSNFHLKPSSDIACAFLFMQSHFCSVV